MNTRKSEDKPKEKTITLIVNGREKEWNKKEISFEEVVILQFGGYNENPRVSYTVTFSRGNSPKPQGSMTKGDVVKVKSKMNFNVTATDKS